LGVGFAALDRGSVSSLLTGLSLTALLRPFEQGLLSVPTVLGMLIAAAGFLGLAAIWLPAVERDPQRLADLDRLAAVAPRGETVGICPSANGDWMLHAWMQRRFLISLDAAAPSAHGWFLKSTDIPPDCPPSACVPISQPGGELMLMRCR